MLMNLQVWLYLCSSCGSWVMLQIVLKRKFFIKRPLFHQLRCFLKWTHCSTLMFKTYNKIIDQSDENQSFRVERPLGVCPTLITLGNIKHPYHAFTFSVIDTWFVPSENAPLLKQSYTFTVVELLISKLLSNFAEKSIDNDYVNYFATISSDLD